MVNTVCNPGLTSDGGGPSHRPRRHPQPPQGYDPERSEGHEPDRLVLWPPSHPGSNEPSGPRSGDPRRRRGTHALRHLRSYTRYGELDPSPPWHQHTLCVMGVRNSLSSSFGFSRPPGSFYWGFLLQDPPGPSVARTRAGYGTGFFITGYLVNRLPVVYDRGNIHGGEACTVLSYS